MSEQYGSTHYDYFPGIESSTVDHLVLKPRTTWRGFRAAQQTFSEFPEDDYDLDDLLGDDDEIFGSVDVQAGQIDLEANSGRKLSDKAWLQFNAGKAALSFGKEMRGHLDGSVGRHNQESGKLYFRMRATPGTHEAHLRDVAERVARKFGVGLSILDDHGRLTTTFYEQVPTKEKMGRLFPARQNARSEPSAHTDVGLVLPRSGHSGLRGARTPFSSSLVGEEAAPKPQYTRYGAHVETSFMRYEGSEIGAAVLGVGALAVLYRALGGDPLF